MDNIEIRELPTHLVNKIAAGEVVERPYSVVKELVENSIDAMAKKIFVNIENGGKTLIEVVDDGYGIPKDQVRIAFKRHATSKISSFEDLLNLHTMGFRGEALPSIASVSNMEVITRFYNQDFATYLKIEAGKEVAFSESYRNIGTTIKVKNLFYNVPARQKFLRRDITELRYIINEINVQALSHPEIAFKLTSNGKILFHYTSVDNIYKRILQVFSNELKDKLFRVQYKSMFATIEGYAGSPELARKSSQIYIFVNRRYIKDNIIRKAIMEAYRSMLEKHNYPFVILFIDIEPEKVDFNVHPTKREVKFDDTVNIFSIVVNSLKKALNKGYIKDDSLSPLVSERKVYHKEDSNNYVSFQDKLPIDIIKEHEQTEYKLDKIKNRIEKDFQENTTTAVIPTLWQLHSTYIITSIKEGMIIIDQHAAAERILYEKILKNFEKEQPVKQKLLFPEVVELNTEEFTIFLENKDFFQRSGFDIKEFGNNSVVIESVPAYVHNWESANTFKEILDDLLESQEVHTSVKERIAKYTACRTAIKAGDKLNPEQMQALIDDLFSCEFPYTCPHGRPTLIRINLSELEKRFGRK